MVYLEHNADIHPLRAAAAAVFPYPSGYFVDAPRFQSYTSVSFIITEFRGIPSSSSAEPRLPLRSW